MKIVITGTTGVGKSTTVQMLGEYFSQINKATKISQELVIESPFFSLYFENIVEWGFLSQLDFLLQRFWQYVNDEIDIHKNHKVEKNNFIYLYDRHFIEDKIFANLKLIKNTFPAFHSKIYQQVYNEILIKMDNDFQKIDYLIMLKADFDEIINRMKKRGRKIEGTFSNDYWLDLYNGYYENEENLNLFKKFSKNFIIIDTTNLTPIEVLEKIKKQIKI